MQIFLEIQSAKLRRTHMMHWIQRIVFVLALMVGSGAEAASPTATQVNLVLSADQARPGETVWAGVHFQLADDWHTYWRYGGEAAQPPEISWELPEGVTAGEIQWPAPEKYSQQGILSYVYHHETVLLVPLSIEQISGTVTLKAEVRWLECKEVCLPRNRAVTATLLVGDSSQRSASADLIDQWRTKVPPVDLELPLESKWDGAGTEDERNFVVLPKAGEDWVLEDFYPHAFDDFEVVSETAVQKGEAGQVGIRKGVFKYDGDWPDEIAGLVLIQRPGGGPKELVETVLRFGAKAAAGVAPGSGSAGGAVAASGKASEGGVARLVGMLFSAFLGGFILNFMPCVLPVIALKILGFVSHSQESPGRVKQLGLLYGVGVVVSFLILAGLVIGVQQAGRLASWGMQFQNVGFLVPMTVLILLVALNFFGVFEISLGGKAMNAASALSGRDGYAGAFFNGVLATILATPCTAPFLATALGFAFAQPPAMIVLFFVTIALGLAFPYVLLSFNPKLMKYLPKPGPWMVRFKVAMGFPMLATAVWLYSVSLTHFSAGAELWLGLLLVVVGLAAWIWGQFVQQVTVRKPLSMALSLLIGLGGAYWILERELQWRTPVVAVAKSSDVVVEKGIEWRTWSHEAVAAARSEGHPVLVDFTAKWCQNCKANKRFSIEIDPVREKLKSIDAVTFRADFTHYDPTIAKELERYERAGVPLVLVFSPDPDAPAQTLPPLLTPQIVLDALDEAATAQLALR